MNSTTVPTPSEQAMSELQMNTLRVSPVVSASLLWDRHLTKGEQRRLGGDFESAYQKFGTVGMWVELRGVTRARAVVEVAKLLGLLNEQNANWLLTEIGEYLDADDAKQAYIDAGHLVLQERPREAFWNGNEIEIDWNSKSVLWDFVWQLARFGKVQAAVERTTLESGRTLMLSPSSSRDWATKSISQLICSPRSSWRVVEAKDSNCIPAKSAFSNQLTVSKFENGRLKCRASGRATVLFCLRPQK